MSWHYLQGQEEASWADTSLDGAPSALLSLLPTREASCSQGSAMECSPSSPCGMTCEPSTDTLGAEELTLSAGASPVRISALPGRVTDLTGNEADCGPRWPGSLARYNPDSRSWRTAQCSLLGGLTEYSATFPRWGTMRNGELWERTMPVLRTAENASGYWATPTARDHIGHTITKNFPKGFNKNLCTDLELVKRGLMEAPTPSGNWPTPTCSDAFTDKLKSAQQSEGSMHSVNLSQAVKMWPTPMAQDAKHSNVEPSWLNGTNKFGTVPLHVAVGGQLNPDWVEWLMNWPVSWSSLTPLSHEHFNEWLARTKASATKIQAYIVPGMRNHGQPSQAPQGPEQAEQHAGEHCDTVPSVPREGTREAGGLGKRQCSPSPLSDMRTGVPVEQNAEGQGVQQCLHGGDGQAFSGEAMGRTEQGEAMHELREDLHLHTATSNDLQPVVREYSGPPKPWWSEEPIGVPRVATGIPKRADRLKAIGNGQVPAAVVLAWNTLYSRIQQRS